MGGPVSLVVLYQPHGVASANAMLAFDARDGAQQLSPIQRARG